ncbi:MAG TPA: 3-hydroxyacyl-CoA dehydrogenase [Alphaproteobacteria bacterium]
MARETARRIAIVGAGLIGRSWAIVFARAGYAVAIWDGNAEVTKSSLHAIEDGLKALAAEALIEEPVERVLARIRPAATLAGAAADTAFVQESIRETPDAKRAIFAELDKATPPDAIIASSTSIIPGSVFMEGLEGRQRCLVAHPVNPPHLVPLVELVPSPWTDRATVARAKSLYEAVGQVPIVVEREIEGFILNRLQAALLNEAFRLVEDGYVSTADLDKTVKHGLGLRWSFMGPFETIDLNAPEGVTDYCRRYGQAICRLGKQQADPRQWTEALVRRIEAERRLALPARQLKARAAWRDRRLAALIAHKRAQDKSDR